MIEKIVKKLIHANEKYRHGDPIMSDKEYDQLLEQLSEIDPQNDFFSKIGIEVIDDSRKVKLPIPMFSMNKIKTIEEMYDWCKSKEISLDEEVIITPKFDGLSLCVDEINDTATTRGDGLIGQNSNEHYKLIKNKLNKGTNFKITYGEVIMSKSSFLEKYSDEFANPRNLVAGMFNSKTISHILVDIDYIKYGGVIDGYRTKSDIIDELNKNQKIGVNYYISRISDLSDNILIDLFKKWSIDYEIDGLIIEVNDLKLQEKLGRESSTSNPCFARAFKHESFEQKAETEILKLDWIISKGGLLKPVARLKPVHLDGVTVSNVTCNNARFVKEMGLGPGSIVKIVRSGMVIPKIIEVIEPVEFQMPDVPNIDWNENGVELITLTETDEQKFKQLVSFFEILETDSFGEGVIKQLWDNGHRTVKDILNLSQSDLEKIDRFGKRKAQIVWNSIKKATNGVSLSKLQHATGIFKGLGSKKLALLEHFTTKPSVDQILEIEGFAEISAQSYIDGYDKFFEFIDGLPITIEEKKEAVKVSNDLDGMTFVFTGLRDKIAEETIISKGGKIGGSVSKNTTHLVCKDPNSVSSKLEKAKSLGVQILSIEELNQILRKSN